LSEDDFQLTMSQNLFLHVRQKIDMGETFLVEKWKNMPEWFQLDMIESLFDYEDEDKDEVPMKKGCFFDEYLTSKIEAYKIRFRTKIVGQWDWTDEGFNEIMGIENPRIYFFFELK